MRFFPLISSLGIILRLLKTYSSGFGIQFFPDSVTQLPVIANPLPQMRGTEIVGKTGEIPLGHDRIFEHLACLRKLLFRNAQVAEDFFGKS